MKNTKIIDFDITHYVEESVQIKMQLSANQLVLEQVENRLNRESTHSSAQARIDERIALMTMKHDVMATENKLRDQVALLNVKGTTLLIIESSLTRLPELLQKVYPNEFKSPAIQQMLFEPGASTFKFTSEYFDHLYDLVLHTWFHKGLHKVFDLNNRDYYDSDKMGKLIDDCAFPDGDWFKQLLYTLHTGDNYEYSELIRITESRHMELVYPLLNGVEAFMNQPSKAA